MDDEAGPNMTVFLSVGILVEFLANYMHLVAIARTGPAQLHSFDQLSWCELRSRLGPQLPRTFVKR
ncbi:uncharacterized protein ColSpa_10219 [Colletotrichum spaethianum]|uniref:Uncharacterized protein n=1 Tax=Colletotrichum spaethianum TaxID=700344 RepID=A0AA37PD51_9PEZI|nr:uncharacterized protein ColSpa_10219 [Colletotrichum spaethianum]GKT50038.1 hypothetical protein ColSpa_10219 [Colletotrichum spaethianum]